MQEPANPTPPTVPFRSLLLDALSTLLLALSATMFTDLARRLFNSDPDSVGLLWIALQAFCVLAASSTFTAAGWAGLSAVVRRRTGHTPNQTLWRLALSALLLLAIAPLWRLLPPRLAVYYNNQGMDLNQSDPAKALSNYRRAISLDPSLHQADVNLGGALESFYRYDDAANAYQTAIASDPSDLVPYSNLARVLLMNGNALTALRVTQDALIRKPPAGETKSALLKNQAWAESDLGLSAQAIADATASNSAAGDCLLGKLYAGLGRRAEAQDAWNSFLHRPALSPDDTPFIEPDCTMLAEVAHENP